MNYNLILSKLNNEIYEKKSEKSHDGVFSYISDGLNYYIYYDNYMLWNSSEDTRDFYEDENEYEPLEGHLKRKFNDWVDSLSMLKFEK